MRTKLKKGGLVLAALFLVTACHYAGSGTLVSSTGHGIAVFSFNLNCPTGGNTMSGTIMYIDLPAHVQIRGVGGGFVSGGCAPNFLGEGDFFGTYTTMDAARSTGAFTLTVIPGKAAPPALTGGALTITLLSGPLAGYSNSQPLLSGQIYSIGGPGA